MSLLEVEGLSKSFAVKRDVLGRVRERHPAVRDVTFSVDRGETLALVGESGAGKSTTARLVLRLIQPDTGRIAFDGVDVMGLERRALRDIRQRMQMIFQDPTSSLDPRITVGESIAEPMVVFRKRSMSARQRVDQTSWLLERVGLSARHADRYPSEMSGGQLQRIAIARALTLSPDLLVCDEPVASLDMSVRAQVLNLMGDLQEEFGLAYLFITHDLSLVRVIADHVAVMRMGEIVEQGRQEEVFTAPKRTYTRELLSAVPTVHSLHGV